MSSFVFKLFQVLVSRSGSRRLLAKAPEALKFALSPLSQLQLISSSKKLIFFKGLLLHRDEGWTVMEHGPYGNLVALATSPAAPAINVPAPAAFDEDSDDSRDDINDDDEERIILKRHTSPSTLLCRHPARNSDTAH